VTTRAKLAAVDDDGRTRCTATSRRSGERCRNRPRIGTNVCRMHGGSAPQVQRSARQRLAAMVDPALDALVDVLESRQAFPADRVRAAVAILDRTGYHGRVGIDVEDAAAELEAVLAELAAEG
jgi:hypothetical protein